MKIFTLPLICIVTCNIMAQTPSDLRLQTQPKEVTLYLSGAQISSRATGLVKEGLQTIIFSNLPASVDQYSVQVKADADIVIFSVDYQLNYLQPQDNKAYKLLEDSLKIYRAQLGRLEVQKQAWVEEMTLLQENRSIGGANNGVNVTELGKMADFVRNRINDVGLKKLETEEKEFRVSERIKVIEQQLSVLQGQAAIPSGEVMVQFSAANAGNANFELNYFTGNCGWSPLYDIRVKEVGAPAMVTAKANVFQNTGQDWKNVDLTLCTGNPTMGNTQPMLNPWFLYLADPVILRKTARNREYMFENVPAAAQMQQADDAGQGKFKDRSMAESVVVDNNTATNALFKINTPYTINSSGKNNFVEIQKYSLKAAYAYFSIPKLDNDAFLVADISEWQNSELLPGEANVYFENNFVGKSWFDTHLADDTLRLGLGRDNQIRIERKLVKDFTDKSLTGQFKKVTRTYEITVKNNRKAEIILDLEDQVPLSSNEEIDVNLIESNNAFYDKESGKLSWKLKIKPGEQQKITLTYAVRYPRKSVLNGF